MPSLPHRVDLRLRGTSSMSFLGRTLGVQPVVNVPTTCPTCVVGVEEVAILVVGVAHEVPSSLLGRHAERVTGEALLHRIPLRASRERPCRRPCSRRKRASWDSGVLVSVQDAAVGAGGRTREGLAPAWPISSAGARPRRAACRLAVGCKALAPTSSRMPARSRPCRTRAAMTSADGLFPPVGAHTDPARRRTSAQLSGFRSVYLGCGARAWTR